MMGQCRLRREGRVRGKSKTHEGRVRGGSKVRGRSRGEG